MDKARVGISEAESQIMDVLWAEGPQGAEEIAVEIGIEARWSEATVRTLINRLIKKGAIKAQRNGRRVIYHPLLTRDDYISAESETFLNRLFEGRLAPMVAYFSDKGKLSDEEVRLLRRIVDRIEDEEG